MQVGSSYPYSGTYSLLLDDSRNDSTYSIAAAILTVDPTGQSQVDLDFWCREWVGSSHTEDGVFLSDEKMHGEMAETRLAGKVIGGHYASLDLGLPFHGYAAGGPEDDHEGTRLEDAVARIRQGMKAMLRLGSGWHDVASQIRAVTELGLDPRHFILVTDDSHSGTLVNEGHMDRVVRHAIEQGANPMIAIQMATLNPAEHFNVAGDVGQIAPGRYADILLVDELTEFVVDLVIARGRVAAEKGKLLLDLPQFDYPQEVKSSVHLGRVLAEEDFVLASPQDGEVQVNVIGVVENQAPTRHLKLTLRAVDGQLPLDTARDLAKVALVECLIFSFLICVWILPSVA